MSSNTEDARTEGVDTTIDVENQQGPLSPVDQTATATTEESLGKVKQTRGTLGDVKPSLDWKQRKINDFIPEVSQECTIVQLMGFSKEEREEFAGTDVVMKSTLRKLFERVMAFRFWFDALGDSNVPIAKDHDCFIVTSHLLRQLPLATWKRIDSIPRTDTVAAFEQLFDLLSHRDTIDCGRFSLPRLDLEHRNAALKELAQLVATLASGAKGNGGTGRLLLGPKGTGKTVFLQAFSVAAALLFPKVRVIYIDYASWAGRENSKTGKKCPVTPAEILYYAYLCEEQSFRVDLEFEPTNLQHVRDFAFQKTTLQFLIIADEFNKVYSAKGCDDIIRQFQYLGQLTGGRASAILTGSSAALCELCYKRVTPEVAQAYPSYNGIDLNSGRFPSLRMRPARGRKQFRAILEHIVEADEKGHDEHLFFTKDQAERIQAILGEEREHKLALLYKLTGGKFRDIQEALETDKTTSTAKLLEKRVKEFRIAWEANKVFRHVLEKLIGWRIDGTNKANISWEKLLLEDQDLIGIDKVKLYDLADQNLLFVESDKAGLRVGFETGVHEDLCKIYLAKGLELEPYERTCLQFPFGQLGIDAEHLVLESLAKNSTMAGLRHDICYEKRSFSVCPCETSKLKQIKKHLKKGVVVCGKREDLIQERMHNKTKELLRKIRPELPLNELMKEYPDKTGADAILFVNPSKGVMRVYRLQIKLGQSTLGPEKAKRIATKLKNGNDNVRTALQLLPYAPREVKLFSYIITTRPMSPDARHHFKANDVAIISCEDMYNVWLPKIVAFDQRIGLGIYAARK